MVQDSPFTESHKLLRCLVVNRYQETSVRFIEIEAFRLWEYLMKTKHGLTVRDPSLCLWLNEQEFASHEAVFEHAGSVEAVNRIVVDLFDADYGFSQAIIRYARQGETDQVVEILKSHMPPELAGTDACQIEVVPGCVVQQQPDTRPGRSPLVGLQG